MLGLYIRRWTCEDDTWKYISGGSLTLSTGQQEANLARSSRNGWSMKKVQGSEKLDFRSPKALHCLARSIWTSSNRFSKESTINLQQISSRKIIFFCQIFVYLRKKKHKHIFGDVKSIQQVTTRPELSENRTGPHASNELFKPHNLRLTGNSLEKQLGIFAALFGLFGTALLNSLFTFLFEELVK